MASAKLRRSWEAWVEGRPLLCSSWWGEAGALRPLGWLSVAPTGHALLFREYPGSLSARLDRVWTESSQVTGKSPGQLAGKSPGQLPGQLAGKLAGKSPGQLPGKSPGQLAGKLPGQLPGQLAGKSPGQSPGKRRAHLEARLPSSPPEHAVPCALIICLGWGSCPGTCCQAWNS